MGATQELWQQRHVDAYIHHTGEPRPAATPLVRLGIALLGLVSLIAAAAVVWQADYSAPIEWALALILAITGASLIAVAAAPRDRSTRVG